MSSDSPIQLGEEAEGVFSAAAYTLHDAATAEGCDPLTIVTPREQWAYAVSFPLQSRGLDETKLSWDPVLVRVKARVERGRIGIGCVKQDLSTFLDEAVRTSEDGETVFDLIAGPLGQCRRLMVRNAAPGGELSRLILRSIHVFRCDLVRPAEGEALPAPPDLTLKPVADWSRFYGMAAGSLAEKIRAYIFGRLERTKPMPWLHRLRVHIHPGNEMCRAVFVSGLYEPNSMLALRDFLPRGGTFLDVGANMGLFSLLAARMVGSSGQVFAFEPSSRDFDRLVDNLRLNGLDNVQPFRLALSDTQGRAPLLIAGEPHAGHNTLGRHLVYDGVESVGTEVVATVALDDFAVERRIDRLDLVKIDTEGGEYRVLLGARKTLQRLRPVLMFEVFDACLQANGASTEDLERVLFECDYDLWEIDDATAERRPIKHLTTTPSANMIAVHREDVAAQRAVSRSVLG